ncbi:MAG: dTDP-4-dehydrorhamnose reductase [Chitinophagaceae bacterium]
MKHSILVTGANGQLGRSLRELENSFPAYTFHFFSREEFPIDSLEKGKEIFASLQPAFCINCAAYTAVDKAETESATAESINATAPGLLAKLCKENGARLIHISTDYVFNGNGQAPYLETDPVDPVNTYGAGKLKGEQLALQNDPATIIIRTSWVYAPFGHNFVKTMLRLMQERPQISVVADQTGTPTYAPDLAAAIMQIVTQLQDKPDVPGGIYHFSNAGVTTWHGFATAIKEIWGHTTEVLPIPTEKFPTPAKRPGYSVLSKEKICADFGIGLIPWEDSLKLCIERIRAQQ